MTPRLMLAAYQVFAAIFYFLGEFGSSRKYARRWCSDLALGKRPVSCCGRDPGASRQLSDL